MDDTLITLLRGVVMPLLEWYDREKRTLAWRSDPQPYHVWLSEIMLQQTRVEAVKEYFDRFLRTLPTIEALAGASEETLLKLWEGLGYYRRVRHLQEAAKIVVQEYGGTLPRDFDSLRALPGIGEYTAGAIASIAFGLPTPAVDGNVLRVIARLAELEDDITKPAVKKRMTEALRAVYPAGRCGDFTQSLMELGAMVCVPNGAPLCHACPLSAMCGAYQHDRTADLPRKTAKKARRIEKKTVFLLESNGAFAVRKRTEAGLLESMWEFPNTEGHLSAAEAESLWAERGVSVAFAKQPRRAKHIFTHVEWQMLCYRGVCQNRTDALTWVTAQELADSVALPTAFRQLIERK